MNGGYYLFTEADMAGTLGRRTKQELSTVFGQGATFYRRDSSFEVVPVPNLFSLTGSLPTLDQELYMTVLSRGGWFF